MVPHCAAHGVGSGRRALVGAIRMYGVPEFACAVSGCSYLRCIEIRICGTIWFVIAGAVR